MDKDLKVYCKLDYLEYRKNLPSGTIKDKILSLCYENYKDSNNTLRTDILQYVLGYKISLSNNKETTSDDYTACSNILGGNFRNLTYTKIAEEFGYELMENPRVDTTRKSIALFDSEIARGNLSSDLKYTGEYFSYIYGLNRRILVLQSTIWNSGWSREIKDMVESIRKRVEVFTNYFSSSSLSLPDFIVPFKDSSYDPGFLDLCYSDDTYGDWRYKWSEYTGRDTFDWTREDRLLFSRYEEAIEQYLSLHQNMVMTMSRLELLYYAELSILLGISGIWDFQNQDIDGEKKSEILNKVYIRLFIVGKSGNADMSEYAEMAEKLKGETASYYDDNAVLDILGYRIYL